MHARSTAYLSLVTFGLVCNSELLKYSGSGMVCLLEQLFSVVWHEETVPRQWR